MDPASARTVTKTAPPEQVAAILGVSPEEISTVKRARIMLANEAPVQLADSYIPVEIADGTPLEAENSGPGGIIARFAEMGLSQVRITEEINVRPPTAQEVESLELRENHLVYSVTHVGWTSREDKRSCGGRRSQRRPCLLTGGVRGPDEPDSGTLHTGPGRHAAPAREGEVGCRPGPRRGG
ncbi:UTRA domain-containing protein [Streptomyces sp. NPDC005483]|uniref:UTRA domain-containing protein n=1 Tax=Streptomyces sp. NPDC005483 TaxID=3154882 RepID=UPI0033BE9ED4